MSRVTARAVVPGPLAAARRAWYDVERWAAFVDGFARVVHADPGWPSSGRVVWASTPHGRGRVTETARPDGVIEIDDERLSGTQIVRFVPGPRGAVEVTVQLDYRLKHRTPLTPLVDVLFVRRALADALGRTLARFTAELEAAGHPVADPPP